uniref:recombinase family protein n=1 Tax=Saccharopolyspora pogona TaxID=333966 RepID=UPI001CC26ACF|nr:recombinase family protein [Saccharopolyspora pogona]
MAGTYHTGRFMKVPRLAKRLRVPTPADRGPGQLWRSGTPPPVSIPTDTPATDIRVGYARCSHLTQELQSQLDALAAHGIPREKIFAEKVSTRVRVRPKFEAALDACRQIKAHAPHCRVECPSPTRARTHELDTLRPMFQQALQAGSPWIAAPRPPLRDELYTIGGDGRPRLGESEPTIEAANVLRCGRDLFVQISGSGNELGYRWLETVLRQLGDYRVHPVRDVYTGTTWTPASPCCGPAWCCSTPTASKRTPSRSRYAGGTGSGARRCARPAPP